nr:hypothetical protein [Lysinibacillus timonensis]
MQKVNLIFTVLFCVILLSACTEPKPNLKIEVIISPISEDEYIKTGRSKGLISDYKRFEFDFQMEHDDSIKERDIEIDNFNNLLQVFNEIDGISRLSYGSGFSQDNDSENFAMYYQEVVFYAKALSDDDLKKAFSDEKINVSWFNNKNEQFEKEYIISDLIEFSSGLEQ